MIRQASLAMRGDDDTISSHRCTMDQQRCKGNSQKINSGGKTLDCVTKSCGSSVRSINWIERQTEPGGLCRKFYFPNDTPLNWREEADTAGPCHTYFGKRGGKELAAIY